MKDAHVLEYRQLGPRNYQRGCQITIALVHKVIADFEMVIMTAQCESGCLSWWIRREIFNSLVLELFRSNGIKVDGTKLVAYIPSGRHCRHTRESVRKYLRQSASILCSTEHGVVILQVKCPINKTARDLSKMGANIMHKVP